MKVHDWNLPYGEGGWNVNWSQELKAKKERGVVLNVSCSCFFILHDPIYHRDWRCTFPHPHPHPHPNPNHNPKLKP